MERIVVRLTERTSLYLEKTAPIDMGLLIEHGFGLDAADDARKAPHRPNVCVTDVPRDVSVAPDGWNA